MPVDGNGCRPVHLSCAHIWKPLQFRAMRSAALYSKSSTGRIGLEHLHAGWIDPGFCGQLTLEFKNVAPWPFCSCPVDGTCRWLSMTWWSRPPAITRRRALPESAGATPAKRCSRDQCPPGPRHAHRPGRACDGALMPRSSPQGIASVALVLGFILWRQWGRNNARYHP